MPRTTGAGFGEPLVFAPSMYGSKMYDYRVGLGLNSSMEHFCLFDDFDQAVVTNVPVGWTAAIIDTGATVVIDTTAALGANGVLQMSDATLSEGAAIYRPKGIQLTAAKKFFMEMRVRTDDVTDNVIQFGLTDLTAVVNPEDLWTTVAANLVTFGILDGSASLTMLSDKSNSGSTVQTATSAVMVANTWHVLGISYDGANLRGYIDGRQALQWSSASTTIPTGVALAPFIGVLNGNGAGANVNYVDYLRIVSQR
jgi:hypothetical protein